MKKVMVFNFKTMQFEQASDEEGKEFLSLIGGMNADCAAQQKFAPDVATELRLNDCEVDPEKLPGKYADE